MTCFGDVLKLSWDDCPADLGLIEQITLARNRDQHPERISTMNVDHTRKDREKHPYLFFVSETDRKKYADPELDSIFWMSPSVHVSREMLFAAIEQVETLAEWLEEHMRAVRYGR